MSKASTLDKECFLCTVKEIDGNLLADSQESSLSVILCQIFNTPNLKNNSKKFENISYCYSCKERILKLQEWLEMIKNLEKKVLEEKYLIELQLEQNHQRNIAKELHHSPGHFGIQFVNECETFEEPISKLIIPNEFNTPRIYDLISTEKKSFPNLSLQGNDHFVDSTTDSPSNHAQLPLSFHMHDFYNFKSETFSEETNSPTDITNPFEGIVPETDCMTESNDSNIQKTFICGTCENTFDDYNLLDEHYCNHDGSTSFKVSSEKYVPIAYSKLNSYFEVDNVLKCKYCVEAFPDRFTFEQHERSHTIKKPFKSSYCENKNSNRKIVKKHERIHTGEKPYQCQYCNKAFRLLGNMKSHEHIHKRENHYKCRYCDKTFEDFSNMKIHEDIHKDKRFKCKLCQLSFCSRSNMKTHESIHTGEKPYECKYCNRKFHALANMKKHEYIHTGEKPFKCRYCDKTFGNSGNMKRHECIHTGDKPFKCKFCGKTFIRSSDMKQHERIHTGEKPFKCKFCGKTFIRSSDMKQHERIHTGEKPFKCKFCGKTFIRSFGMKKHERIHTGEKRFKCSYCDKTFRDYSNMKRHEIIHKEEKPCTVQDLSTNILQ